MRGCLSGAWEEGQKQVLDGEQCLHSVFCFWAKNNILDKDAHTFMFLSWEGVKQRAVTTFLPH